MGDRGSQPPALPGLHSPPIRRRGSWGPGAEPPVYKILKITYFVISPSFPHAARQGLAEFMIKRLGVTMKGNWQIYPVAKRMVSAVGYRFARTHTILRGRNFLRFTRQCRRVQKKIDAGAPISHQLASGLLSRIGQLKHCDSHKIRVKYVDPIGVKNLKEVVHHESKRRRAAQRLVHAGAGTE